MGSSKELLKWMGWFWWWQEESCQKPLGQLGWCYFHCTCLFPIKHLGHTDTKWKAFVWVVPYSNEMLRAASPFNEEIYLAHSCRGLRAWCHCQLSTDKSLKWSHPRKLWEINWWDEKPEGGEGLHLLKGPTTSYGHPGGQASQTNLWETNHIQTIAVPMIWPSPIAF